jgi:hypothetical protein
MPSTFEKLNRKSQTQILVIEAPESFQPELAALRQRRFRLCGHRFPLVRSRAGAARIPPHPEARRLGGAGME